VRILAGLLALSILPATGGCSFLLVDGPPPPDKRDMRFYCTRSIAIPVVDGIGVGLSAVGLARVMSENAADYEGGARGQRNDALLIAGLLGALAASSVVGALWVTDCRAAMNAYDQAPPRAAGL
jgi:hypothetical protein